jgi:hypothetical protein
VDGCAECREAVTIAALLLEADRGAEVHVPSAAQMWWRWRCGRGSNGNRRRPGPWCGCRASPPRAAWGVVLTVLGQLAPVLSGAAASVAGRVAATVPTALPAMELAGRVPSLLVVAGALVLAGLASTAVYFWVADE